MKTNTGRFFEDYSIGQVIDHACPRTLGSGERALYHALYPSRHALYSSDLFAQSCGLKLSPIDDLIVFHIVFGKSVPDVSINAVANLGYAETRWLAAVYPGDTLRSRSTVIGLKQNSSGKTGVIWVKTEGFNQENTMVISFIRWVMVRKKGPMDVSFKTTVPKLKNVLSASELSIPESLTFDSYNKVLSGSSYFLNDYQIGEIIDHADGVTVTESEHVMATRLWQNTAKVHFDTTARSDGRRLIYGGHVISMARALSFNGLANMQIIAAINGGSHANPCFAGDTIYAWSEVLDTAQTRISSIGAIRLRLVATKGAVGLLRDENNKYYDDVFLDLDYWAFVPI
ncbi:MAG: MaoC family dehydratase [Planktomarina sp.]|nr:MaoC family dehydratase [Planktomarina sp.]